MAEAVWSFTIAYTENVDKGIEHLQYAAEDFRDDPGAIGFLGFAARVQGNRLGALIGMSRYESEAALDEAEEEPSSPETIRRYMDETRSLNRSPDEDPDSYLKDPGRGQGNINLKRPQRIQEAEAEYDMTLKCELVAEWGQTD